MTAEPTAITETTDRRASSRKAAGLPDLRPKCKAECKPRGRLIVFEGGGRVSVPAEKAATPKRQTGPTCPQGGCTGRLVELPDYTPAGSTKTRKRFAWLTGHAFDRKHKGMTRPNGVDVGTVYRCTKCRASCNVPPLRA